MPEPTESALAQRIRRLARNQELTAQKSRRDGKWYFADRTNFLQSPEQGLDTGEAYDWLRQ